MDLFAKKYTLTDSYVPLESSRTVISGTLSAPSTNAGTAYVESLQDGGDVPLEPGERYTFSRGDLSGVKAKGTVGDVLVVIGGGGI